MAQHTRPMRLGSWFQRYFQVVGIVLLTGCNLLLASTVFAQQVFPRQQTKEQIKAQIKQLKAESRVLGSMIDADGKKIYINSDTAMRRLTDASLGPIFGREEDYSALADKINAATMACQDGALTSFCGPQLKSIYDDARKLLERPVFLLTGEELLVPDPTAVLNDPQKAIGDLKQLVSQVKEESSKVIGDLRAGAEAGSLVDELMDDQHFLLLQKNRIDTQIDSLSKKLQTSNEGEGDTGNSQSAADEQGNGTARIDPDVHFVDPNAPPGNFNALDPNGTYTHFDLQNGVDQNNGQGLSADAEVQISSELVDDQAPYASNLEGTTIVDSGPLVRPIAPVAAPSGGFWQNLLQIGIVALQAYNAYEASQPHATTARGQQAKSAAGAAAKQPKPCTSPEQCAALRLVQQTCSLRNDCSRWGGPPPPPPPNSGQGCGVQCTTSGPLMCWGNPCFPH